VDQLLGQHEIIVLRRFLVGQRKFVVVVRQDLGRCRWSNLRAPGLDDQRVTSSATTRFQSVPAAAPATRA